MDKEKEVESTVKIVTLLFYILIGLLGVQLLAHVMIGVLLIMGVLL